MIKIKDLILKNFLSHVDTHLDLEKYSGLVLIEGKSHDGHYSSNGSGKSTLLEGIVYALTGDTLRGVSVNDVINRNYKKNANVSLEFSKGGDSYLASRYRKHQVHGDALVLEKNGEDISKRVNKDTQKLLEDTIGISYKVLVSTMLLGEGLSSRFTQLSDPEKKSLIESTLSLNYDLSKLRESANSKLKLLSQEKATIDGEIEVLEAYADKDIELLEDSISENRECVKIYTDTITHITAEYERILSEIDGINPKIQLISDSMNKVNALSKQYTDLMQLNGNYQEERDKAVNGTVTVCQMCHQHLQSEESRQAVISNFQSMIDDNLKIMESLSQQLETLPNIEVLREKYETLSSEYQTKSAKSRELMQSCNQYQVKLAEVNKDIELSLSIISQSEETNKKLSEKIEERKKVISEMSKWDYFYKLFSPTGIIVNILSDAIEYINERISTYSNVLLEKQYKIEFLKGKISLVDSTGSSYQSLSNGEKRRLDIAIQFALHDYVHVYCGNSVDTIFLDEVLDTLDDVGIENIITVLRLKLAYCKLSRIFVISHNSELKSHFDSVITVSKDSNGDSRII